MRRRVPMASGDVAVSDGLAGSQGEDTMRHQLARKISLATATICVSACGGGGGDATPAFIPPATPTPTPTPTPAPAPIPPPIPAGPIGLQSSAPFSTVAAYQGGGGSLVDGPNLVQFAYSPATDRYTITVPGFQAGQLVTTGGNGSFNSGASTWLDLRGTTNKVTVGSTSAVQALTVAIDWPASFPYKYTSTGSWFDPSTYGPTGVFAYGIPTAAGDVPVTGAATYAGSVQGVAANSIWVGGSVSLTFDFGAGSLSGVMKPRVAPTWDAYSLGDYVFRDTVFAKGSTSFSGAFTVSGSTAPSSFQGSFNGPQAAELMANWTAPYLNPETKQWGTMSGIWTAKKP